MAQLELSHDAMNQPNPVSTDLFKFHNLVKIAPQIVPSLTKMQTFLSVCEIQSVPPSLNTTQLKLGISPELTQILEALASIRLEGKKLSSHTTRLIAVFNQISAENAQAQQDVQVLVAKHKQVSQVLQQLSSRKTPHSKLNFTGIGRILGDNTKTQGIRRWYTCCFVSSILTYPSRGPLKLT